MGRTRSEVRAVDNGESCPTMRHAIAALLVCLVVTACQGGAAPTPTTPPTVAYMLAAINADDSDHPDTVTDRVEAERAFHRYLNCVSRSYPDQTERETGDITYAAWAKSSKDVTLLQWAQLLRR